MTSGLQCVYTKFEGGPLKVKFVESADGWFGFHLRRPPSCESLLSGNRFVKAVRSCLDINAMYNVKCHPIFLSVTCDASRSARILDTRIAWQAARRVVFPHVRCPFLFKEGKIEPETRLLFVQSPGRSGECANASFEPGSKIFAMHAPAAMYGVVVAIPVLTLTNAGMAQAEACAIIFGHQFKGDRRWARLQGFPGIAEAVGRVEYHNPAGFDRARAPLKPDRSPGAQIDIGFLHKPALQVFFLSQGPKNAFRRSFNEEFFLKQTAYQRCFLHSYRTILSHQLFQLRNEVNRAEYPRRLRVASRGPLLLAACCLW